MPKSKKTISYEQQDELLFVEWLLEKLEERGNPNIQAVRANIGLTTESGKLNIVNHISKNKDVYKNYIADRLSSDDMVYRTVYY